MPVFKYLVLNQSDPPEYIEVEQSVNDSPLFKHPLTGEPIKRVVDSPSLFSEPFILQGKKDTICRQFAKAWVFHTTKGRKLSAIHSNRGYKKMKTSLPHD